MQINKHVHAVKIPFTVTIPPRLVIERFVYAYLVYGTQGICLIDTGVSSSVDLIFDYIRKTDRKVSDISRIIQTHTHPDHIGATRTIKAETGCSVEVHPAERHWLENVGLQAKERPVPGFDSLVSGSVAVNGTHDDGEIFDLGCGLKFQIFHTPGHSRGSISLLLLGFNILFSGDAVPVPGEMPVYEDVQASVASIKKLKAVPEIRYLLPSWDEPAKGDEAYRRMDEGLLYLQKTHAAVRKCMGKKGGIDPIELSGCALRELGLPPELANPITARSFAAHLDLLNQKEII